MQKILTLSVQRNTKKKKKINCKCYDRWLHPRCVGLQGLTKAIFEKIHCWKCPICFKFEAKLKEKLIIKEDKVNWEVKIKNEVKKKKITNFILEITEKVEKALTNSFF